MLQRIDTATANVTGTATVGGASDGTATMSGGPHVV